MRPLVLVALLASTVASFAPPATPAPTSPKPHSKLPDTGSPALLMGLSLAGVALASRFFIKKNG